MPWKSRASEDHYPFPVGGRSHSETGSWQQLRGVGLLGEVVAEGADKDLDAAVAELLADLVRADPVALAESKAFLRRVRCGSRITFRGTLPRAASVSAQAANRCTMGVPISATRDRREM